MRRFFSFVITVLIAGAIGFGLGAYVAPTDKAVQFRALVDGKIAAMKKAIHRVGDKSKSEPKETRRETAPAETTPPAEAETPRKEAEPDATDHPQSGADSGCGPASPNCAGGSPPDAASAEGELANKTIVQLRGRNIADDWASLVAQLQNDGTSLPFVEVVAVKGGLCQTYRDQLGLPGCSDAVIALAKSFNPGVGDVLSVGQKVKVPLLPLHPSEWTIVLDRSSNDDAAKLKDFKTRWKMSIKSREEYETQVRLTLNAYEVFLPAPSSNSLPEVRSPALTVGPSFDKFAKGLVTAVQKSVISDPGALLFKPFSNGPREHFKECTKLSHNGHDPTPYSLLLGQIVLPPCAKSCSGNCPEINLFDTKVFLHPAIRGAVVLGGKEGDASPNTSAPLCPPVEFNKVLHHGTMLASIMVGQDDANSEFVGPAPSAHLRSYDASEEQGQQRWAEQVQDLGKKVWDTPQVFVFAGEFKISDRIGRFIDDSERLHDPAIVPAIIENQLLWITAAGQPSGNEDGHQIATIIPESPMNLGDQKTIVVVTSCGDNCIGREARLWTKANYSKKKDGLVNLAAPGGSDGHAIPGAADGFQYSEAFGTSQATAFVGGLAAAMLSCYPDKYKAYSKWLKVRLQVTADPMPRPKDAEKITGGIVNIPRALLDPAEDWLDMGQGFNRLTSVRWCRESFSLNASDTGEEVMSAKAKRIGAIIRFHDSVSGKPQWQIADVDPVSAKVRWSGPGTWADNEPVLAVKTAEADTASYVIGAQIYSFLPNTRNDKIFVASCPSR